MSLFTSLVEQVPEEEWTTVAHNGRLYRVVFAKFMVDEDGKEYYVLIHSDGTLAGMCRCTKDDIMEWAPVDDSDYAIVMMRLIKDDGVCVTKFTCGDANNNPIPCVVPDKYPFVPPSAITH